MTTLLDGAMLSKGSLSLASKKLPSATVDELGSFLANIAHLRSADEGYATFTDYVAWIAKVLREPKGIATNNIQRLLWHHAEGRAFRGQQDDLQFIVGLMQTDTHWGERTTLSRDQESAFMMVEHSLAHGTGAGISYGNAYGNHLEGVRLLYPRLGEYVINHPDRAEEKCALVVERGIRNIEKMRPLLK